MTTAATAGTPAAVATAPKENDSRKDGGGERDALAQAVAEAGWEAHAGSLPGRPSGSLPAMIPTGEQFVIEAGPYRAVAVEAGGGLREATVDGRPLLEGYAEDALPDGGRGQVLAPWPNRVRDGRWTWQGRELQLPLNEVAKAQRQPRPGALGGLAGGRPGVGPGGADAPAAPAVGLPVPARPDGGVRGGRRHAG